MPEFFEIDVKEYADLCYQFMIGIPGFGSSGFCMMGPEELKRQRWTYIKYWSNKLHDHVMHVADAFKNA